MKKIILILLPLVLVLGIVNIALADEVEIEDIEEEIVLEESTEEEIIVEEEQDKVVIEDETSCPHTWGEWYYDLTEYEDGSTTYFRSCECGAYEELGEQAFYDAGGQYEDCDKGRHNWCEDGYCEECGYSEEI